MYIIGLNFVTGSIHLSSLISIILQTLIYIPGIFSIQATKSSSLGGQQVLDCALHFPNNQRVTYIIEWKKDGLEFPVFLQHDGYPPNIHPQFHERVRLVNGISLEISHIKEPDEGWYECKVIYLDGVDNEKNNSNGTWIYLNVHIPPKILSSSPQSFHQPLGSRVKIYCRADGSPKPTVTWMKDNRLLKTSSRLSLQNEGTEVIILDLQESDGGSYKCTFQNDVGLITQTIHLIVEGQAYIIDAPSNKTAVLGQRVRFTCQARGYPSNITYRWYKDNVNVNMLQGFLDRPARIQILENTGGLLITDVEKVDMGWYSCRPSNGVGQDPEASAYLNVTYKPEVLIHKMPRYVIWALGFREGLDCPVDANPPAYEIIWTKNGAVINYRYNRLENGTLLVENVQQSDTGGYRCTAVSSFGTGDSEVVQVEVKDPPRFTVRPNAQYIRQPAQSVVIPCVAVGTPLPTITWRRAFGSLNFGSRVSQVNGNLSIRSLQKSDHGIYECEASNEVRRIVTSTEIVIQNTTPHAPYNVSVEAKLFSATVRWIPAYSSTPQYFLIWYRSIVNRIPSKAQTMRVEPQNTTRFTLYNLEPDTLYEFKVMARNELGSGQYSQTVQARTLGYKEELANVLPLDANGNPYLPPLPAKSLGPRPAKPFNLTASLYNRQISLRWTGPSDSSVKIFQYIVEYNTGNNWVQAGRVPTDVRVTDIPADTSFTFTSVDQGKLYKFRVFSRGVLSFSVPSLPVTVSVPEDFRAPKYSGSDFPSEEEDDFGLSPTEIGGILGGALFLIVAITLSIIAILCNRRKNRKRRAKYGNVKYLGPPGEDSRPEYATEWSDVTQNGRRDVMKSNVISTTDHNDYGVFMLPESSDMYRGYDSHFISRSSLYNPEMGQIVPNSIEKNRRYIFDSDESIQQKNSLTSFPHSSRSLKSIPITDENDSNGFKKDNGFLDRKRLSGGPDRQSLRSRKRRKQSVEPHQPPLDRPLSTRATSNGDSLTHADVSFLNSTVKNYPNSFRSSDRSFSRRTPQFPTSQVPNTLKYDPERPYVNFPCLDDDEEVFMPPPIMPGKPGFPRHSSMKPGSHQTYLTDSLNTSEQPFMNSDISSVLPSPFSDNVRRPYQRRFLNDSHQSVPYHIRSLGRDPDQGQSEMDTTVVARQQSLNRTLTGKAEQDNRLQDSGSSSESSGRPVNYTRDQLFDVVDMVRRGPRAAKKAQHRGQRGSGSELGSISESPHSIEHGPQIPESVRPSVIVRDRPLRPHSYGAEPYMANCRSSVNSSGHSSTLNGSSRGRGDTRSLPREDLTPDSVSSGIGSRNTSSQLTGSSLHSRPSRLGSNLASHDHDLSEDSALPLLDYPPQLRKDISGDENYEFDSYNAVESDLLEALQNYREVNNGKEDLLSALQEGLSTGGMFAELYPKPSRQSRYSDSEKRFEKLRGEFQKYREKQRRSSAMSDSHDSTSARGVRSAENTFSNSKWNLSRGSYNNNYSNLGYDYYGGMGDNSSYYRAGPMDSDML